MKILEVIEAIYTSPSNLRIGSPQWLLTFLLQKYYDDQIDDNASGFDLRKLIQDLVNVGGRKIRRRHLCWVGIVVTGSYSTEHYRFTVLPTTIYHWHRL